MLRTGVYPSKCIDEQEKFNELTLLEKEEFYSSLNISDVTDADYMQAKIICLYIKSYTLPLVDAFENFRKMYLEINKLSSCKISFISSISLVRNFKEE